MAQQQGPLRGVEKTALGAAMVRALESRREDRLFDDPWAQAFVDAASGAFPTEPPDGGDRAIPGPMASLGETFYTYGVLRTRFFDDYLTAAAAVARCSRATVPGDLRTDWTAALAEAGFDPASPAACLAEGVLIYLSAAEAGRLLAGITGLSAPGSQLSFEHSPTATAALTGQASQMPTMQQYARPAAGTSPPSACRPDGRQSLPWPTGYRCQPGRSATRRSY
jgi:O-methyltransferase involved in polyketide biosynthesis